MKPAPLYSSVCAGLPSAISDGETFDLAEYLVQHPFDTFYIKVSGHSMNDAGIFDGDLLIVDRAAEPHPSDIVVAQVGDGFTVKRFKRDNGRLRLVPANPDYKPIDIDENARICGVVKFSVHPL